MIGEESNPEIYEQLYLLNIESQNRMAISEIENFAACKEDISKNMLSIIEMLGYYEKYFLCYEPIAQRLSKNGRLQLYKRLEEILGDTREAIDIFQCAYQKMNTNRNIRNDDNNENNVVQTYDKSYRP